ncbi:hypothetical protein COJ21_09845 [Priestia megaterium]|uniref:S-4TM family putative pore-forming effector n=1 Tax=Priestia megaterium TaxID=1404 RepID=UPI000BFA921B|nr:S-4TM family putative pore-forming effector [Priestia megaterium]PFK77413.1 hypothetical protein COJ21_09845 [Priestia megaterium]
MNKIYEIQNDEKNYRIKVCFKYLYDKAKFFYNINLIISLIIPIVALIFKMSKFGHQDIIVSISSCWIITSMVLNILEQKLRLKAVILQEEYDINVLGLKENKTLMYKKILTEERMLIVRKMLGKNIDRIYYDGIECENSIEALLLAQRQNVLSDRFLRERYCLTYKLLLLTVVILSVIIAIILNQTVKEFLIGILIPSISLISFIIQQTRKLSDEIARNEQIGELIEKDISVLKDLHEKDQKEYRIKCREYQNYIFTRRLNAALIPNFVYRLFRNVHIDDKEINQALISQTKDIQ